MLKILHVTSNLAPSYGGVTRALRELAYAQASSGHLVHICTTNRDHPPRNLLPKEYYLDAFPSPISIEVFSVNYAPLMLSLDMGKWLRRNITSFDICHIHELYRFPSAYSAYLSRKFGVPYIVTPHGSLDPYLHARSTQGRLFLKRLHEWLFDLPSLNGAGSIHYTANEERERAAFLNLRAPSFVVPNGLDWNRFQHLPPKGWLRSRLGLADQPIVLFLGRLHFKKGLDLLIPAFDVLRRSIPDARLVIAGPENDDHGQQVRGWVQERELGSAVHFTGELAGDDTLKAYVDADVFVLPSYTENFGLTVIEALACCLPVVISDQVNIHADVSRADAGIVTRCDISEVAQALQTLLTDPVRRYVMGIAGRQLVNSQYTWPPIVEELIMQYEVVIASSSPRNILATPAEIPMRDAS